MAKYYIQSGKVSFVVCACDVEGAALWTMHRIMDEKICDFEDELISQDIDPFSLPISETEITDVPEAIPYEAMLNGLAQFGESIQVSQRGFGRTDAGELQTEDIFQQWRQLMQAVDRLHDRLG
ncbi:MAG: hypothetical protein P8J27_12430 [Mariniblastus sp.]|nr:hypothetical protein [Mariniblastus sp.]